MSVKISNILILAKFIMRTGFVLFILFLLNCFQLSYQKQMFKSVIEERPPRPRIVNEISPDSVVNGNQNVAGVNCKDPFFIYYKQKSFMED